MQLKQIIEGLLAAEDYQSLANLASQHGGKVASYLIGLLCNPDETTRWRAIRALGWVTQKISPLDEQKTRRVIRQLIWNLNPESGGIGWGMPEALGEILACNPPLIEEYVSILISYITEEEIFLENEQLQRGVVWAIGRIKNIDVKFKERSIPFLISSLESPDPYMRGTAAWSLGEIWAPEALDAIKGLQGDKDLFRLFEDGKLVEKTVDEVARGAIQKLGNKDMRTNSFDQNASSIVKLMLTTMSLKKLSYTE